MVFHEQAQRTQAVDLPVDGMLQQADLQGLSAKDTNPGLQAFQINIHLGNRSEDDD